MVLTQQRAPADRPARAEALDPIERAVLESVVYADVFDWPPTIAEIHRYLGVSASREAVEAGIARLVDRRVLAAADDVVMLAGRRELSSERERRRSASSRLWRRARIVGRVVASLPWVRLVAVSGSLAADAATDDADIDLFVVTADHRLWLARAMTIVVVRIAAGIGWRICPNYIVAESALELPERDRFTAHELARLVPIGPSSAHADLLARNAWHRRFMPNLPEPNRPSPGRGTRTRSSGPLRLLFDRLERRAMDRSIRRLTALGSSVECRFDASVCKGHAAGHRRRTLTIFEARLASTLATIE